MEFNLDYIMSAFLAATEDCAIGDPENVVIAVREPFWPNYGVTASIAYRHSIESGNQYRTHTGFKNPSLFAQLAWGY